MKWLVLLIYGVSTVLGGFNQALADSRLWYVVKSGDNLGALLSTLNQCPLYGKSGNIQKVVSLNPKAITKEGNFVHFGTRIELPYDRADVAGIQIESDNQIIIQKFNFKNCQPNRKIASDKKTASLKGQQRRIASTTEDVQNPTSAPIEGQSLAEGRSTVDGRSTIEFIPGYRFMALAVRDNLNGGTATLLSSKAYDLGLTWTQFWNQDSGLRTWLSYNQVSVTLQEPPGRTFSQSSHTLSTFQFGIKNSLSKSFGLGAYASVEQEISLQAVSATTLTLQTFSVPKVGIILTGELMRRMQLALLGEAFTAYHLSAKSTGTSFKGGAGEYGGRLKLRQQSKVFSLTGGIYYRTELLQSAAIDTRRTDLGAELGLEFSLGE